MKAEPARSAGMEEAVPHGGFDIEVVIGTALSIGVLISAGLVILGLAWHWLTTGQLTFHLPFTGANLFDVIAQSIRRVVNDHDRSIGVIWLGLAVLMLTPYARVVASVIYFAFADRDWKFTAITLFVLAVLTISLFIR